MNNSRRAIILIISILLLVFGYYYYQKKHMDSDIVVTILPPAPTALVANAVPDALKITFSQPVAPLAVLNQVVKEGIALTPKLLGTWRFTSDRELLFTPEVPPLNPSALNTGWIPGATYRIDFVPSFFMEGIKLNSWHYEFKTPEFRVHTPQANFYQDPQDPALKKAIAQFEFTHPIDKSAFEKRLELVLLTPLQHTIREERTLNFSVVYDPYRSRASVHTESLPVPKNDQEVLFRLKAGSRSLLGGNSFQKDLEVRTEVPSQYTGLRIGNVQSVFAKNNQEHNERVLVIETTTPVKTEVLATRLKVWQLPLDKPALLGKPAATRYPWVNSAEIGPEVLELAKVVPVTSLFSEQDTNTLHSFTYTAEADQYLFMRVEKGLDSVGGYILAKTVEITLYQDPFPPEIHLLHEGSLLSLTGDKTLSVMTRDVKTVRFEVSRVFPNMIQHLVQMTGGRFDKPYFKSAQFSSDNLTDRWTYQERVPETSAGTPAFLHFSFSKISALPTNGLFFLKVQGWDAERKIPIEPTEERFILITDLGLLVKDNADGSHDVFVLSLRTGQPESNAEVRILGQNGLPLIALQTDAMGHVYFPSLVDFVREQQPLVYVVQKGDDFSFLPYDRGDRKLNFSKFDISGDVSETDPRALDAFMFTDRDLYRPGETAHLGMILKAKDWKETHAGMPFEFVLTDPRGMPIHKEFLQLHDSGFHSLDYSFLPNALTGTYTASVYLKGENPRSVLLGSHALSVEEFTPDRLKITARFSPEKIVHIELATLFGAPAAQHTISARLEMSSIPTSVPGYPDYHFFDSVQTQKHFAEKFPNIKTDPQGKASLDLNLSRFAKSSFKLDLLIQGFEGETGRSVNTTLSTLVSPLPYWVGYKRSSRGVHLIALDPTLHPIQTQNLILKILELESVSVLKKQPNGTLAYESIVKEKEIKRESLVIPSTGLDYPFSDQKPGNYILTVQNAQGMIFNKIAYARVGENYVLGRLEPDAGLQVSLNKPFGKGSYAPGEWVELQIKAPYHGSGLITIEREKVYAYQWFQATKNTTSQRVQIPSGLEGNAYVGVSFVRALDSPEMYTSSLSYAVSPFSIETQARTNRVQLELPETIHPGETIPIRYQTEFPTQLLIFAVDEGILSAAHYQSPDPMGYFFRKRALQVETSQILDLIFPETRIAKSRFSVGGGEGEETEIFLNPFKRKGKPAVVFWSGLVTAKEIPSEVSWTVPDYFDGSLRFMAVAVSADRMGALSVSKTTQSELVLMPHIPAFVAPGDEFSVQATVYNQGGEGEISDIQVTLEPSLSFTVLGKETQTIRIQRGGNARVRFLVKANSKLGPGLFTFKATLGSRKMQIQEEISVRPAMPFLTHLTVGAVKAGEKKLPITKVLFKEKSIRTIGVSAIPLALSQGLVTYLEHYPYACTEQLVSQAFPLVLLEQKMALPTTYTKQDFFNKAIAILQARQNEQGGFGYWAANAAVDPFVSVYATHFLLESEAHGYRVPPELFQNALSYIRILVEQTEIKTDYNTWAYALYLLTRAGEVPTNALSALYQALMREPKETWKNTLTPLYMAATYQLLQQNEWAASFLKEMHLSFEPLTQWEEGEFFADDPLVYAAQSMYLLAKHWKERVPHLQGEYFLRLSEALSQQRYHSLSAAYLVLAFDALADVWKPNPLNTFSVIETEANRSKRTLNLVGDLFSVSPLGPQATAVTIQNKNPQHLFYQLTESGFDLALPKKAVKEKLEVIREYRDEQGRPVKTPVVGQKLNVSIKLRALSQNCACDPIAVVDLLPGGLEIDTEAVRSRFQTASFVPDYIDIREDRIIFFGSADMSAKELNYPAYAAYPGTFTVPPILAESMYHRQEHALSLGGEITIEPPATPPDA